jgi:hypothetical protein
MLLARLPGSTDFSRTEGWDCVKLMLESLETMLLSYSEGLAARRSRFFLFLRSKTGSRTWWSLEIGLFFANAFLAWIADLICLKASGCDFLTISYLIRCEPLLPEPEASFRPILN